MRHDLIKYALCSNTFAESDYWIKPGSKFLFGFVDILKSKVFTKGILDLSINQKILSADR